jgi:RHS repeat-associated protein
VPAQLIRYQLGNHLGSACLELDVTGQIITYEEYYPYGSTSYQAGRSAAEVSLKRYRYTGMERDEETGLNYHGARYYAPWLGRWISCDPLGPTDHINLYVFCCNNPANLVDPNGQNSDKVDQAESDLRNARDHMDKLGERHAGLLNRKAEQEVNVESRQSNVDDTKQAISDAETKQLMEGDRRGFERGTGKRELIKNLEQSERKLNDATAALEKTTNQLKSLEKEMKAAEGIVEKLTKRVKKLGGNVNAASGDSKVTSENLAEVETDTLAEKIAKLEASRPAGPGGKASKAGVGGRNISSTALNVVAAIDIADDVANGKYARAAEKTGLLVAATKVPYLGEALVGVAIIQKSQDPEIRELSLAFGAAVEAGTGSRTKGAAAASTFHVVVTVAATAWDMVPSALRGPVEWAAKNNSWGSLVPAGFATPFLQGPSLSARHCFAGAPCSYRR